ncbi:hypothetical protein HQ45_08265 [Porphyromonas crevioricanis]|uniref:phage virion morphogenesis protein n=1 Tax=Porphyromonas crevioricanis TaxID=393921 RepID=UPI00052BACF5|nr:phage virion morphogenesis protein [Porphyromonas crevioricanis]KGN88692.1 hypothetical protein HQ45_08265 [Porphyromonas crevioricanis]
MQRTPTPDDVVRKISKDVSVELQSHVMDNFRAQAFYDQPWTPIHRKGTILVQTAGLRNSIQYIPQARGVTITSSKPYAQIHNEGSTIRQTVTQRQRIWAWRQYYESGEKETKYKAIALLRKKKLTIRIPARPFVGAHPRLYTAISEISDSRLQQFSKALMHKTFDQLKKGLKRR